MQLKITGEQPFQVLGTTFTIGPSESGYDLMFSADGKEYSKLFTVGANTNRQVTQVAAGSYYFLSGNTDTLTVNWMGDCWGGSGSGGGSYVLPVASENTLGGVKIGSGLSMSGDTLVVSGGTSSNTRVVMLNKLTQQERLDLYNELASLYDYQNSGWSSAYTEDMFAFYLDLRDLADQQAANVQDAFEGFFPMQCVRMHPTDYGGAAFFTGVEGNRVGNGWLIDIRYVICYDGSVDGPSTWENGPAPAPQEVKIIELSTTNPADFTEDDIDAMQEMVDYLAEFPVDNLPAARIKNEGKYLTLGSINYVPEDTEQQTPEERIAYTFSYTEVYGEEAQNYESQNGYIETFYLNAENVEESYNLYWDSSEEETFKLSAIYDFDELDPLNGDVAAKTKTMYKYVRFAWDNISAFDGSNIIELGNLVVTADVENATDTLYFSNDFDVEDHYITGGTAWVGVDNGDSTSWSISLEDGVISISLRDQEGAVWLEEDLLTLNECEAYFDEEMVIPDGLYQYDENEGEWYPLAKSIVINDYLDAGQDKVAEFYAMMKPYMEGDPKGWPFNLYYRTKFFDANPTLATLTTAWISDYQTFGNENLFFVFEYVGYAHDFGNSQAPNRRVIEIAEDGSYDSNGWDGKTPSVISVGYVWFGNDSRGRLTYDADNDRFEYDNGYIATGDTTTVYDDLIDNLMTDHLFTNELIDGTMECLNFNLLYVVESGETKEYSYPLLSRRTLTVPVTIDSRDFYKEITYNYGDWKLTALYGADDGNNAANLRITALP